MLYLIPPGLQLSAFEELSEDLLRVKGVKSSGTLSVEETTTLKVIIARLKSKLLDISELFNNIAMPHKVWVRIVPESATVPRPSFLCVPLTSL